MCFLAWKKLSWMVRSWSVLEASGLLPVPSMKWLLSVEDEDRVKKIAYWTKGQYTLFRNSIAYLDSLARKKVVQR